MPDRDALAEPGAQAPEQLRRERDLGHQHEAARGPGRGPPRSRAGRPRSCPSRSPRAAAAGRRRRPSAARPRPRPPAWWAVERRRRVRRAGAAPPAAVSASPGPAAPGASAIAPASAIARRVGMVVPAPAHSRAAGRRPPARARTAATSRRRGAEPVGRRARCSRGDQALARRAPAGGASTQSPVRGAAQRAAAPRRQHQPQAGGHRGQVVARHPARQLEQLAGHRRARRRRPPAGTSRPAWVGALAAHHHAEDPPRARAGTRPARPAARPPPARRGPRSRGSGRGRAPRPGGRPGRRRSHRGRPRCQAVAEAASFPPASRPTAVLSQVKSGSGRPKWP